MSQHEDREAKSAYKDVKKLAEFRDSQIDKAINAAASTREGRAFLWWLLELGKVGTQPFTTNALTTAFGCGELNVGNGILERIVRVDPGIYVRLQQESLENDRSNSSARSANDTSTNGEPGSYDGPGAD